MIRLQSKLLLRAFNGECEGAITNVSWNNAERMQQRIRKAFGDINKLGDVMRTTITDEYLHLKVEELRMSQEVRGKSGIRNAKSNGASANKYERRSLRKKR